MKPKKVYHMAPVQVRLPGNLIENIDRLVKKNHFASRCDAIRYMIHNGLTAYLKNLREENAVD